MDPGEQADFTPRSFQPLQSQLWEALTLVTVTPPARAVTIEHTQHARPLPWWSHLRGGYHILCSEQHLTYGEPQQTVTKEQASPQGSHGPCRGEVDSSYHDCHEEGATLQVGSEGTNAVPASNHHVTGT